MTVDIHTGEVVAHMSEASARESVERAKSHLESAADEIVRQISGNAWLALGYESWDEMRQVEYRGAAVIVPRASRPELVARLRSEGLSQREIAQTVGVSQQQVSNDLTNTNSGNTDMPDSRTDSLGRERPTSYTPRVRNDSVAGGTAPSSSSVGTPPAPSVSDDDPPAQQPSEAVDEYLDSDEELKQARYIHAFVKTLNRSDDFMEFEPEKLGELADNDVARTLDEYGISVRNFIERFHRSRRGLQVIQGGKQ